MNRYPRTKKDFGLVPRIHIVHKKPGEKMKDKEPLCLTCYGLSHAVEGKSCKAKMTNGKVCGTTLSSMIMIEAGQYE
jgi:hypothetical protein